MSAQKYICELSNDKEIYFFEYNTFSKADARALLAYELRDLHNISLAVAVDIVDKHATIYRDGGTK